MTLPPWYSKADSQILKLVIDRTKRVAAIGLSSFWTFH